MVYLNGHKRYYARAVKQLAKHYQKSPDQITQEELRAYFLYLKNVRMASRSTQIIARCGITFFLSTYLRPKLGNSCSGSSGQREEDAGGAEHK